MQLKKRGAIIFFNIVILVLGSFISAYGQAPTITSFSPSPVCQGEMVTITGTEFTGATSVKLGSINAASFTVNSATNITANIANQAITGTIAIVTPGGTATSTGNLIILPAPIPVLTDVNNPDAPFTNCNGNATYPLKVGNNSTNITGTNIYQIDWGDNTPIFTQTDWGAGAQTTHTYNSQGYFNIIFTITPSNGCTKTATYNFYNGQNPLAGLTTTHPTTGLCVPAPVEFQISNWSGNSAGTSYQLDFGDGSPRVILPHPLNLTGAIHFLSHTYTTSSCPNIDFTATLYAVNGCFTTKYTLNQIVIRKKPDANFTVLPTPACVNGSVCFTNKTTNGVSGNNCNPTSTYLWDFGDGTTSTLETPPCHVYTTAGAYQVTLTASNAACGSGTITKPVTVSPASPPPVTAAGPVLYCRGQVAVPLTATGTGLLWYTTATGGTGNPIAPTPSTTTAGNITYYVSQTIPNNCESPRIPVQVTINALPTAPVVITPVQLCQNQVAAPLTATGVGLLWYTTATGGTGSPTPPTPITTTTGNTTYYVSQTNNVCEGPRASIVVTVNSVAAAPVVISPLGYCQNQVAVPLKATGSGLLWYNSATGGTGDLTPPTPSTSAVGSIIYYVSQVTGCGESPRAFITVNVNASPTASITYGNTNICNVMDNTATPNPPLSVTQTGDPGGSYSISPLTGLSINSTTGTLNPSGAAAGTYTIKYTLPGTGACSNFTTTATVTVSGSPTANISYPAVCTSDAATKVNLTGTKGGGYSSSVGLTIDPISGTVSPGTSIPGTYTVTYTILPSSPCPGFVTTTGITVSKAPSASITYDPINLCNVIDNASTPNPPINVILTGTQGGSYSISPTTGLIINPVTGSLTPSGAVAATYTIKYTVPGTSGCSNYSTTTVITVSGAPTATINYRGSPYCRGLNSPQQVTISGTSGGAFSSSQGLSISATTGEINPSLSTPGMYKVTYAIVASSPCPGFITTTDVEIDDSPVLTFPTSAQSICSGGTAVFIPSSTVANTIYIWSVVGQLPANVSGISSGTSSGPNPAISLSFTNAGPNSASLIIKVVPANPSQNACAGAPYNLTLSVNPVPVALTPNTFNFCMNTPAVALTVNPTTGYTVKWYDNNTVLLNAAPTINTTVPAQFIYYVSQSNTKGCESPKSKILAIVNPTAKIISSAYTNPTTCGNASGSIVLNVLDLNDNAIPNLQVFVHYDKFQTAYKISNSTDAAGKITIPLTAGTYSGIYVETSGCMSQKIPDIFILKDPNPPAQPVAGYNPPICSETPLTLTALSAASSQAGPVDYVWAGPAFGPLADTIRNSVITFPSAKESDDGTYVVYAIQNNCISATSNFQVVIKQGPSKPRISTRTPLCLGDDLTLQATSSIQGPDVVLNYLWRGPGTGFPVNSPNAGISKVKIQDGGIYSITVSSPQTGCSATSDTLIQIGGYPIVKFPQDTLSLPTGFVLNLLPVITNAAAPNILPIKKYEWSPMQDITCNDAVCSLPVAIVKNNICYTVKATNIYGCSGSDIICVKVFCQSSQIFIPNAFTPRGDVAENTKLIVRASGISSVKSFRVFNRWGKIVFERNNFPPNSPDFGWDGRINGKLADPGVYVYTAEVICENGIPYTFKGNVTLL